MKERIKQLEKIGFEWNVDVDVNMQAKKNHSESIKRQGEDSRHQEGRYKQKILKTAHQSQNSMSKYDNEIYDDLNLDINARSLHSLIQKSENNSRDVSMEDESEKCDDMKICNQRKQCHDEIARLVRSYLM